MVKFRSGLVFKVLFRKEIELSASTDGNGLSKLSMFEFAGISAGNATVGLVADFPDEENFHTYQKHALHVAAITHNRKFVVSRTAIQMPLPKSSL